MRIGILTFHRAINYGAILQCYALFKTLTSMGHDVEVIDYRPDSIEKYRMLFRKKDFKRVKGFEKIRYLLSCITLILSKKKTSHKFDNFIKNHLTTSHQVKGTDQIPKYYDAIFFGSDQIWSPEHCEGLDKVYYGQFHKGKTKFYTYAASIGRKEMITGQIAERFEQYIQTFDRISVRESQVQIFLNNEFNIGAEVVCDPTILLPPKDYLSLVKKTMDEKYVLLFNFVGGQDAISFAKHISKQLGVMTIEVKAVTNPFHKNSETRNNLSPEEFLGFIQNARCVVTDSFHATVFSAILHKDFYTLTRHNNNDRTQSFLNTIGLSDRMMDKRTKISFEPINYNGIDEKLDNYRKQSMAFLNECLCLR